MQILPPSIRDRILSEGGSVPFARFMGLALTDADAGYYTRGAGFLGEKGDFTTAPRRVPAFSRAVARFLADLIDVIPAGPVTVIEVGAGEGDLAAGVLGWWEAERPDLRDRVTYLVDDVTEASRRRQAAALVAATRTGWRTGVAAESGAAAAPGVAPEPGSAAALGIAAEPGAVACTGVVISNELFDALPVHVVDVRGEVPLEAWVELVPVPGPGDDFRPREVWKELSPEAARELAFIAPGCSTEEVRALTVAGFLEVRPAAGALLERWAGWYDDLAVLTVDYGDWLTGPTAAVPPPAPGDLEGVTCLRADVHRRSLRGYYRHFVTHDPYQHVGRQDLTADVDFRALSLHGVDHGFEPVLFTTLATFLHAAGVSDDVRTKGGPGGDYTLETDMEDAPLVSLLDAEGLGGLFKVLLQVRERDGA